MLVSAALAAGRELIVARSQMNESEDGCRLSDVIAAGGAVVREVGAANHVRLDDYAQAIGEATAAILLVQTSNYVVAGSMGSVALTELIQLAGPRKLAVIHDAGGGGLLDVGRLGLCPEPVVNESVKAGAGGVLFCGDKLLGGPQCAMLVGRRTLIETLERHPAAAAMQADRLTLAALQATLRLYRDPEKARRAIPLLRLLHTSAANLKNRAERLARAGRRHGGDCGCASRRRRQLSDGRGAAEPAVAHLVRIVASGNDERRSAGGGAPCRRACGGRTRA